MSVEAPPTASGFSPEQAPAQQQPTDAWREPPHLTGMALVLATMTLAMANFIAILDTTIVNVSIPTIAGSMAVSPSQGAWAITSYSVAEAIMVPLTGFLATRFGAVRVMLVSMICFGIFSALAGSAPGFEWLVLFRVMQGLAGGPMMPMSQALLMQVFPPEKRSMGMAIWMMTTVLAPLFGPILGGTLADTWGWRWSFYINIPVIAVAVTLLVRQFASRETQTRPARFDFIGIGLLVVWVGAMQIMLDTGRDEGWFESGMIWGLAAVAAAGFALFLAWELTDKDPAVNLRVFRSRNFCLASVFLAITFAVYFGTIVLLPLWLQTNLGYTATWSGYAIALTGISAALGAPVTARLMQRGVDPRALITLALLWLASMAWLRTQLPPDANFWAMAIPQMLQGIAMPMMFIPLNSLALMDLKPSELAGGAGLTSFMRTTSAAFATSIVTSQWDSATVLHRAELVGAMSPGVAPFEAAMVAGTAVTGTDAGAAALMDRTLQGASVMVATSHMFALSVLALILVVPAIWLMRRPRGPIGPAAPGH